MSNYIKIIDTYLQYFYSITFISAVTDLAASAAFQQNRCRCLRR